MKEKFITAYERLEVSSKPQPSVWFERESYESFTEIAKLKEKSWSSTTRWNTLADVTGLVGEVAIHRFFDVSAIDSLGQFEVGLKGDRGVDLDWAGESIDVKSTRGDKLWYKFSLSNRFRDRASVIAFVRVEEFEDGVKAHLLGWAFKHKIKPWLRLDKDGRRHFVRLHTLEREGLVFSISELKDKQENREAR